jgi:hypothetical protein
MSDATQTALILRINAALDRIESAKSAPSIPDLSHKLAACEAKYAALRVETQEAVTALDAIIDENAGGAR